MSQSSTSPALAAASARPGAAISILILAVAAFVIVTT